MKGLVFTEFLAEGLIRGCIAHYGQSVDVQVEDLSEGQGTSVRFLLTEL
jgi:hypothetical protein